MGRGDFADDVKDNWWETTDKVISGESPDTRQADPSTGGKVFIGAYADSARPLGTSTPGLIELGARSRAAVEAERLEAMKRDREEQVHMAQKTSQFTKMHFEVVAGVLRQSHAPTEIAQAFAETFARYNPNFNRERFLGAATGAV